MHYLRENTVRSTASTQWSVYGAISFDLGDGHRLGRYGSVFFELGVDLDEIRCFVFIQELVKVEQEKIDVENERDSK